MEAPRGAVGREGSSGRDETGHWRVTGDGWIWHDGRGCLFGEANDRDLNPIHKSFMG